MINTTSKRRHKNFLDVGTLCHTQLQAVWTVYGGLCMSVVKTFYVTVSGSKNIPVRILLHYIIQNTRITRIWWSARNNNSYWLIFWQTFLQHRKFNVVLFWVNTLFPYLSENHHLTWFATLFLKLLQFQTGALSFVSLHLCCWFRGVSLVRNYPKRSSDST